MRCSDSTFGGRLLSGAAPFGLIAVEECKALPAPCLGVRAKNAPSALGWEAGRQGLPLLGTCLRDQGPSCSLKAVGSGRTELFPSSAASC